MKVGVNMQNNLVPRVRVWEQDIEIPTYEVGKPDKNPMFLEKRVYQGSSGRVYPHTVIDTIYDEKVNKTYRAVFIENEYLLVMILPELGGRIQRALDKTNNYDFVYYNHVIKPALVGLAGPWISGGIEFNWPQHHRPSTFDPVDYKLIKNDDGSAGVAVGEIETMFRTKGMSVITLYPGKSYIEIKTQLYNRTSQSQTFLWWANPAYAVNNETRSIFPPDVTSVMDHGKRDVSTFPIATGTYYKMDYSAGVDISYYKNIPVPTSYMVHHSDYDFVGGYDYGKNAGLLHVADHHASPGKKQWTWGCGDFGKAWDRNLTDEDGPYVELMTGCFTDNQPDFSWLAPYEEKTFVQYFMPYKKVGMVKNATKNAVVGLELADNVLIANVYSSGLYKEACIEIKAGDTSKSFITDLSPELSFSKEIPVSKNLREWQCGITVKTSDGVILVQYQPQKLKHTPIPEAANEVPSPEKVKTIEELCLYGRHLEQYRHATFEPADYYREALNRDAENAQANLAYGKLLFGRGAFEKAKNHLEKAVKRNIRSNPNPYDGEAHYYLGLCLKYLNESKKAYDLFAKSAWNDAWKGPAYYQMACLKARECPVEAMELVEKALVRNTHNMKARGLKAILLRRLDKRLDAKKYIQETMSIDCLDFLAEWECVLLGEQPAENFLNKIRINPLIEIAIEYGDAGEYCTAAELLKKYASQQGEKTYPLIWYYLGFYCWKAGQKNEAKEAWVKGKDAWSEGCFPHRLDDILVLKLALDHSPDDPKALYYLGCLYYDKKQYDWAIELWERSRNLDEKFPTTHRNLALAYYNKKNDPQAARDEMEEAYKLDVTDARVLMELDQLYKKLGETNEFRMNNLENHWDTVLKRDDLYLESVALLNAMGKYEKAKERLCQRKFHPWEGGEGKVPAQYVFCRKQLALQAINAKEYARAITLLKEAQMYPENLGEGKLAGAQENDVYYYLALAYEGLGEMKQAKICLEKASTGLSEPAGMMYYYDQPPETIFYQGLALLKLDRIKEANNRFYKLITYGKKHLFDEVRIDFFAVSLPDLLIFDEDLNRKNRVHCLNMMGLGYRGLGQMELSKQCFQEAIELDPNHIGIQLQLQSL